jgi:diguanylate cyclase (GGDEF)-like protein
MGSMCRPGGGAVRLACAALMDWTSVVDVRTLAVMNILLFLLYAVVMLVNARISGAWRPAGWFAGANVSRAASLLVVLGSGWLEVPRPVAQATAGVLAVSGVMMLHRSFAELLERGPLLRWLQYLLVVLMAAGAGYILWAPRSFPAALFLASLTLGVQTALIASVVFRFSGKEVGLAGWLTGMALSLYALIMLMQAIVTLHYKSPDYPQAAAQMERLWMVVCLVTSSAVAFGFMFLSSAKLRTELLWRAQVDELTGLLNRWALKRVAVREIVRCRRMKGTLAVVMMDLDGLKAINDEKGHGCGDVVLQAVAGALQETVREKDSVARMGGDEFCVLLPNTELAEAVMVAERLRAKVHELSIRFRGEVLNVRTSLGVAASELCGLTWQGLMDESDAALYKAKREGKNRVVVARFPDGVVEMKSSRRGRRRF